MGRKPVVEPDVALERVMHRFWAYGYEATSIDDLLAATGMHRGSFYRLFGDKSAAFQAALAHYAVMVGDHHVLPAVHGRGSPCRRLLALLYARLDAALGLSGDVDGDGPQDGGGGGGPGCLVVNTAIELAPHDDEARAIVQRSFDALRSAVEWLVDEAIAAGEVDAGADRELAADQIFTLLQGVNVLCCTGGDRARLRRLLRHTVATALRPTVALH